MERKQFLKAQADRNIMRGKKFPLDFCDVYFYNISRKMSAEICVPGRSVDLPEFFLNFYYI